jgi:serine/threonine protein kinase
LSTEPYSEVQLEEALRELLVPKCASGNVTKWPDLKGFQCLTRLGQGGMGSVYLAQQDLPRRLCTVKLIPRWEGRAIEQEAHLSARLEHPGIARIYSVTWTEHALALVGEWVDGFPLSEILRIAPKVSAVSDASWVSTAIRELELDDGSFEGKGVAPPASVVADWMRQVASALRYAHERGVIHCDIKPSNLMLRRDGRVVLIDFGIATMGDGDVEADDGFIGSFGYASPEQLAGPRDTIGPATDAFSMGATFLHLFTGTRPFDANTLAERAAATEVPSAALSKVTNRRFEQLLGRLLEQDVSARLADMDRVLRDLGEGERDSDEIVIRRKSMWQPLKLTLGILLLLLGWVGSEYLTLEERLDELRRERVDTQASLHQSIVRHSVSEAFRRHLTQCFMNEEVAPGDVPQALRFRARMTLEGELRDVELIGQYSERVRFCVLATMMKVRIPSSRFLDRRDVEFEIRGESWR